MIMNVTLEQWTKEDCAKLVNYLKSIQDIDYKNFQCKLMPDFSEDRVIGIRTPVLRKIGKNISKGNVKSFFDVIGSYYYEEILLRGIVSGLVKTKNYSELETLLDNYSPLVDNWATCDLFCSSFKEAKKYRSELLIKIREYLISQNPWYIRIGIVLLLTYYLDDKYIAESLKLIDNIHSDFYYVSMAQAWLVATAFAKTPDITMEYFMNCNLTDTTFNKAIQKSKESLRISKELKAKLSEMKRTLDKQKS